jgi:hypothetical protein
MMLLGSVAEVEQKLLSLPNSVTIIITGEGSMISVAVVVIKIVEMRVAVSVWIDTDVDTTVVGAIQVTDVVEVTTSLLHVFDGRRSVTRTVVVEVTVFFSQVFGGGRSVTRTIIVDVTICLSHVFGGGCSVTRTVAVEVIVCFSHNRVTRTVTMEGNGQVEGRSTQEPSFLFRGEGFKMQCWLELQHVEVAGRQAW